jgi:hypothetical protein
MPPKSQRTPGRPRALRLRTRASTVVRNAIEDALDRHNKPLKVLAGKAADIERRERAIRQDFSDRTGLKVEAARFLVNRAFDLHLLDRPEFLRLEAVASLSNPETLYVTVHLGYAVEGSLFLSRYLEGELVAAIDSVAPRLRQSTRDAIADVIESVLEKARERAHEAGVVKAFVEYLREHVPAMPQAEKLARARALLWARRQLGNSISAALTGDEERLYPLLPQEELYE